jgi:hypothetical protein
MVMLYITAPFSPALSVAVQFGNANVTALIAIARNTNMLIIAQNLNAVKPKLMMRGGTHVFMRDTKIITRKTHPFLFPMKK